MDDVQLNEYLTTLRNFKGAEMSANAGPMGPRTIPTKPAKLRASASHENRNNSKRDSKLTRDQENPTPAAKLRPETSDSEMDVSMKAFEPEEPLVTRHFNKVRYENPPTPPTKDNILAREKSHNFLPSTGKTKIKLPTGLVCAACGEPISGRTLSAGTSYHPECFTCTHCHTSLEHVGYFLKDSRPYCHLDYHELFSPRCKSCSTPIEGDGIEALGVSWHIGHFFCAGCGDPFEAETPFAEKAGYAWCMRCHANRHLPRCHKCKKPLESTIVNALDEQWHEECFTCFECGEALVEAYFVVEGKPRCSACEQVRLKE